MDLRPDPRKDGWQFYGWTGPGISVHDPLDVGMSRDWRDWSPVSICRFVELDGAPNCQVETVWVPYKELRRRGRKWNTSRRSLDALARWIATYLPSDEDAIAMRKALGVSVFEPDRCRFMLSRQTSR